MRHLLLQEPDINYSAGIIGQHSRSNSRQKAPTIGQADERSCDNLTAYHRVVQALF